MKEVWVVCPKCGIPNNAALRDKCWKCKAELKIPEPSLPLAEAP